MGKFITVSRVFDSIIPTGVNVGEGETTIHIKMIVRVL
jgi:hypothetical protein